MKAMNKYFPIAAIDVETSRYYKAEDMTKMKLESMFCNEKLSDIIQVSIVSIDQDLHIQRTTYTFKPSTPIDPQATKLHGFDDKFFEDNAKLYKRFTKKDAQEINSRLSGMKQVYAHN